MSESKAVCELCGEPMPPGEEVFKYHGYSGPCPKPPLPEPPIEQVRAELKAAGIDTGPALKRVLFAVAVSRLRNPHPAEVYPGPCEMHEQPAQRSADMALVVAAYLAAHPADDGEPVTVEWLDAVGFVGGKFYRDRVRGPLLRGVSDAGDEYWSIRSYPIPNDAKPKTRGEVRRLLKALGVPLRAGEEG